MLERLSEDIKLFRLENGPFSIANDFWIKRLLFPNRDVDVSIPVKFNVFIGNSLVETGVTKYFVDQNDT